MEIAGINALIVLIWATTAFWVLFDAYEIGASSELDIGTGSMGPVAWFVCVLLFWLVAFPLYLAKRPRIKSLAAERPKPSKWRRTAR